MPTIFVFISRGGHSPPYKSWHISRQLVHYPIQGAGERVLRVNRPWRIIDAGASLVAHSRVPLFANAAAKSLLGQKFRECRISLPFEINAIVLLPEHLHTIWTLPRGDDRYPMRWAWIKKEFTKGWLDAGGQEQAVSAEREDRGDHGVRQPRYWEHVIRDEDDFDRHFNYVHYNPVKHGLVDDPAKWKESSIHRWIAAGVYDAGWGRASSGILKFDDLDETAMEADIP